jgi:uncharacterized circularly permuted ATP-grasp superfamily protein
MNFSYDNYNTEGFFDEMFDENGNVRMGYEAFKERTEQLKIEEFVRRHQAAERSLMAMGITFNVYSENEGTELETDRTWSDPTDSGFEYVFGRYLSRPKDSERRHRPP